MADEIKPGKTPRDPIKRITVVERVTHEAAGEEPVQFGSTFSRMLSIDEEASSPRKETADVEYKSPDLGWADEWEKIGCLIITNLEGKFKQRIPTQQEKDEAALKILEVTTHPDAEPWLIYPGEDMRAVPKNIKSLLIRCQAGPCKFTLNIMPG